MRPRGDADEDLRLLAAAQPVVELGDDARAERGAELAEGAGTLRDRDGEQRLASFAELRALGDETQAIEVHVGAAQRRRRAAARARCARLDVRLQAGERQRAGRLHDRARVVEDVLDRGADLVVVDADDLVHRRLHDREGVLADLLHRDAVGEQPDIVEPHAVSGRQRLRHRVGIDRLDADHLHVGPQRLDVGADAGDQSAAADRHEDRRRGLGLCRSISTAIVPCPAITSGSSNGWMNMRPLSAASRSQCCCASA